MQRSGGICFEVITVWKRQDVCAGVFGAPNRSRNDASEPAQDGNVILPERGRLRRKDFNNADDFVIALNRSSENRANTQGPAAPAVYARIVFGVVANDCFASANAFSRKARPGFKARAQFGGIGASSRAAHHFRRLQLVDERDGGPAGPCQSERALNDYVQSGIQVRAALLNFLFDFGPLIDERSVCGSGTRLSLKSTLL